jgi:cytochrome c oxidase assembly protein subunit 15
MNTMNRVRLFRALALASVVLCAIVVVLGAYVRLTAAGLGCPDWPTCYGHVTAGAALENQESVNAAFPDRPIEYGKALREMVHRYAAASLGILIVLMTALAWVRRGTDNLPQRLPWALLTVVLLQGALGMLTVTWLLKPLIVTLHLLGGLTTLALLWWLWLRPEARELQPSETVLRPLAVAGIAVLVLQIVLGGWTSSNYAAVACPDFPTCQGAWWPEMQFREAFVLWRGLGIDYEGGVLDHPARVAVHFAHRLGAIVTAIGLTTVALLTMRRARSRGLRAAGIAVLAVLGVQILLGVSTVVRGYPLALATAHNAGAAALLLSVVTLIRYLWPPNDESRYQ